VQSTYHWLQSPKGNAAVTSDASQRGTHAPWGERRYIPHLRWDT